MKKVIFSVLLIAIVGALVGIGTWAYFSDYETSEDNIFTAGSLDLKVDGEDDPNVATYFAADCVKPGDEGMVEITLENVGCVDGVADIHLKNMISRENGRTEPEKELGDTGPEGELCCNLDMRISADLFTAPPAPPVINGALALGEWGSPDFTCTQTNPDIGSVNIYVESDDAALYVAAEYTGGDFNPAQGLGLATALNIYIDSNPPTPIDGVVDNGDLAVIASDDDVWIPYVPGENDWDWEGLGSLSGNGGEVAFDGDYTTGDGIVEVKIPLSLLDGVGPGSTIGLLFQPFGYDACPIMPDVHPNWPETYTDYTLATLPSGGDGIYETLVAEGKACELWCSNFEIGDLPGDSEIDIMIEWWIDPLVGNIIMTDTCEFDIEFSLNQKIGEVDIVATDIIQADTGTVGIPYDIDVVVHNAGTITGNGWVFVSVEDAGGAPVWGDKVYVENLAPCDTTTVSFTWTPAAAGSYTAVADPLTCPVEILEPAAIVVTGIQQPETIQICEELVVSIDVQNTGGEAGEGVVLAAVVDAEENFLAGPFFIPTGMLDPLGTVKLPLTIGHVDESWRGVIIVAAGFDPLGADAFPCPMMVLSPPIYEVTDIQQPDVVQPCEEIIISVDVHNTGDKPGECDVVTMWIEDEMGMMVWGPEYGVTGPLLPCDTAKVPFGPIHIAEAWLGQTITVFAQACGGVPVTCDIIVSGGPCIVVTGIQQPEEVVPCEELVVAVDIHNAGGKPGECWVEVWVEDEAGNPITSPVGEPVPLLLPCDTIKIPVTIGHVDESWPALVYVMAQACCDTEPYPCPIEVILEPWWCIPYDAESYTWMWQSIGGAPPEEPEPPEPGVTEYDICFSTATYEGSTYRELLVPGDSFYSLPSVSPEPDPMLGWVTMDVTMSGDGDGELYVTAEDQDVDLDGECTEAGTVLTWGDGTPDPAGSAWIHLALSVDVWSCPGHLPMPDPLDPGTWGGLIMTVPLDATMTTAHAAGHVTDSPPDATTLTCNNVSGDGVPFAEVGGPAPYVGTSGTLVATGCALDLLAFGFLELDAQFVMYHVLTVAP